MCPGLGDGDGHRVGADPGVSRGQFSLQRDHQLDCACNSVWLLEHWRYAPLEPSTVPVIDWSSANVIARFLSWVGNQQLKFDVGGIWAEVVDPGLPGDAFVVVARHHNAESLVSPP